MTTLNADIQEFRIGAKVRVWERTKQGIYPIKAGVVVGRTTLGVRVADQHDTHPEFVEWFPYRSPSGSLFVRAAGDDVQFGPTPEGRAGLRVQEVAWRQSRRRATGSHAKRSSEPKG